MNLHFLHVSGSRIVDLTPLANLVSLAVLKLYDNEISDISPLANLTNLEELNLAGKPDHRLYCYPRIVWC